MLPGLLLALHVAAGVVALVGGPLAYASAVGRDEDRVGHGFRKERPPNGRRRRLQVRADALIGVYLAAVLVVATTALGLVALDPAGLWWLGPLALLTAGLALRGRAAGAGGDGAAARRRRGGWGGSYIALVTAALVVSFPGFGAFWVLPTLIGVSVIERPRIRAARLRWADAAG